MPVQYGNVSAGAGPLTLKHQEDLSRALPDCLPLRNGRDTGRSLSEDSERIRSRRRPGTVRRGLPLGLAAVRPWKSSEVRDEEVTTAWVGLLGSQ